LTIFFIPISFKNEKVKISLRFVSWLDILDVPLCSIPYILFKLEEIKKSEVISAPTAYLF